MNSSLAGLVLTISLQLAPQARNEEMQPGSVCGLALRRISPSPPPIESSALFLFSESSQRSIAVKLRRLAWFEPTDSREHDLVIQFAGGRRTTAGYAARGHAVAFLCDVEGPFQVECLSHQRVLFTGFILDGDWITICLARGCRFAVLPDGDYSSVFWSAIGKKQQGPVIHVRGRVLTPSMINGFSLKVEGMD